MTCVYCGASVSDLTKHWAAADDADHPEHVRLQARAERRSARHEYTDPSIECYPFRSSAKLSCGQESPGSR